MAFFSSCEKRRRRAIKFTPVEADASPKLGDIVHNGRFFFGSTACNLGRGDLCYTSFLAPAFISRPKPSNKNRIAIPHQRVYTM